jgi:hypothetical protein
VTMEFRFSMGVTVRTQSGHVGEVTARIEDMSGPRYRFQHGDGRTYEEAEKSLWMVHCIPRWLRPGAEIQWMGTGIHSVFVVKELRQGSKYHAWTFTAQNGNMRTHSYCTPADMRFWRPVAAEKEPRPRGKC